MSFNNEKTSSKVSRKSFIKNAGLGAAAFFIVPRHVLGRGFVAPSDRLTIASIGVGGKGESDIAAFFKSGKADIAYLCDVDDRRAATTVKNFPKAKFYKDWREMITKESKNFDAVSVSTPDHTHAVAALAAMQLGKHVYVQKPLTHDVYEARVLTEAAKKYKVVTQMGNQGASGDGVRIMREWYDAGIIGDAHTVWCWTNRPSWPQGIAWPKTSVPVPSELNWDLWLGTAPFKDYVEKLVPFNWRGWWDYGTGALGDMGCHIIEPAFRVLDLEYIQSVQATAGTVYTDQSQRGYFPEGCPPSSHVTIKFPKSKKTKGMVKLHWMDGGIQPDRPDELLPNEMFGDGGNGCLIVGTKGKMFCSTYGANPKLLPLTKTEEVKLKPKYERVPDGANGHYAQWVEASIAGYGKKELSSPFEIAGPLTEALCMANLALRANDIRVLREGTNNRYDFPGRGMELVWDNKNMKVTNLDAVNQFVKRTYREGYSLNL